jgi:hypothetical protein
MAKVITFGEIMLRLATPGYLRFNQAKQFEATFGGGEANVGCDIQHEAGLTHTGTGTNDNKVALTHLNKHTVKRREARLRACYSTFGFCEILNIVINVLKNVANVAELLGIVVMRNIENLLFRAVYQRSDIGFIIRLVVYAVTNAYNSAKS